MVSKERSGRKILKDESTALGVGNSGLFYNRLKNIIKGPG